ncbi:MAG: YicC/YloC family endoribonuclease, partial [Ignavibacteriaceae bacterium]
MIYSMTGYGKGSAQNENFNAEVEVKSVNSRFLEISLKLPTSLMNREYEIREFIKSKINRGKLSLII